MLKNKIQELEDRKVSLKKGIENSNNQDYIEKVAREELDLQKPGESVVSFIRPDDNGKNQNQNDDWLAGVGNLWDSFINWFK